MILWDNDTVDVTNLNRQILFSRQHVEQNLTKIEAAKDGLQAHLVAKDQTVYRFHYNLMTRAGRNTRRRCTQKLAQNCRVRQKIYRHFQQCGRGALLRFCCSLLSQELGHPLCCWQQLFAVRGIWTLPDLGSTFIVEYYSGKPKMSSFSFINRDGDAQIFGRLHPSNIQELAELDIPYDPKPDTRNIGSNVLVCSMAGLMTVNSWVQVCPKNFCV
jgi:hypothetical protein